MGQPQCERGVNSSGTTVEHAQYVSGHHPSVQVGDDAPPTHSVAQKQIILHNWRIRMIGREDRKDRSGIPSCRPSNIYVVRIVCICSEGKITSF